MNGWIDKCRMDGGMEGGRDGWMVRWSELVI